MKIFVVAYVSVVIVVVAAVVVANVVVVADVVVVIVVVVCVVVLIVVVVVDNVVGDYFVDVDIDNKVVFVDKNYACVCNVFVVVDIVVGAVL